MIADSYVDKEFGTGCVKITPAHDPNDFEVGRRHDLEEINVMNDDATINERGGKYAGMERYQAKKGHRGGPGRIGTAGKGGSPFSQVWVP